MTTDSTSYTPRTDTLIVEGNLSINKWEDKFEAMTYLARELELELNAAKKLWTIVGWLDGDIFLGLPEEAAKHPNAKPVYHYHGNPHEKNTTL